MFLLPLVFLAASCKNQAPASKQTPVAAPRNALELLFPYGSEKEKWITDVTAAFNRSGAKTQSGKPIFVHAVPLGSGETIDNIISGRMQAHLASPATAAFIKLGNAESRAGTGKDLIASTDNLVLSPVVIAMWKPMAEAIGWGKQPLGWSDILALARDPKGWAAHGPLLTPGAAEALVMKVYRQVRTSASSLDDVLQECLTDYQNPIAPDVMEFQIQIAVSEASALEFVPQIFRRRSSP